MCLHFQQLEQNKGTYLEIFHPLLEIHMSGSVTTFLCVPLGLLPSPTVWALSMELNLTHWFFLSEICFSNVHFDTSTNHVLFSLFPIPTQSTLFLGIPDLLAGIYTAAFPLFLHTISLKIYHLFISVLCGAPCTSNFCSTVAQTAFFHNF